MTFELKLRSFAQCILVALCLLAFTYPGNVLSQVVTEKPRELQNVDISERLGEKIPLDVVFISDEGDTVRLEKYFNQGKPVILVPGYYTCPMLCNLVMNGISDALIEIDWLAGEEFQIVSFSIDPTETDLIASAKKKNYMSRIGKPGTEKGWSLLVGDASQSKALADAIGFGYYWDDNTEQYAHAAVIVILTEDGTISRYLYGIQYPVMDLRLALIEASEGKIGSTLDKILLFCYHYDPDAGSYVVFAGNLMRVGGVVTLIAMVTLVGLLWRRERRRRIRPLK